jgi:TetR/AcrR family transcriptional regulator, transcriptional repressor of bet genes
MPGRKAPEDMRRAQILSAAYEVASREGIEGLTVRAVAARAKLSHGLVLFHFKRRAQLVRALLDRVLATTLELRAPEEIARLPRAPDRLRALLRQEIGRVSREPRRIRLFFEYWALGARHAAIRAQISAELDRYRQAFREVIEEVLRTEPARSANVVPDATPEGLAAVAVSFIQGYAVQAMIDPEHFDLEEYLAAVEGLIGRLASPAAEHGIGAPAISARDGGNTGGDGTARAPRARKNSAGRSVRPRS